MRRRSSFVV
nr:unnamed protein product [Callosobruchus chinensis]CAI5843829.1 unnamed protein product [Callosobruchus analis]CAH7722537.1 unnamed protein product [Callosobruchus chinensis]CAH7724419.1 unnamed protein product [Callosobruchus chinensis]CAH7736354.1 unnamed protein product [Callosobruchus chinensis]